MCGGCGGCVVPETLHVVQRRLHSRPHIVVDPAAGSLPVYDEAAPLESETPTYTAVGYTSPESTESLQPTYQTQAYVSEHGSSDAAGASYVDLLAKAGSSNVNADYSKYEQLQLKPQYTQPVPATHINQYKAVDGVTAGPKFV